MTNRTRIVTTVLTALGLTTIALADVITIDGFTDPFESEQFVGSYSGGTVKSTYASAGLEIGYLYPGTGVSAGDPLPAYEARAMEEQMQTGLGDVLGGSRYGRLQAAPLSYSRIRTGMYDGFMSYSTAFGTQGKLDLRYEGQDGLNADFTTEDPNAGLEIELVSGDLHQPSHPQFNRPVPINLTLTSGLGTPDETVATVSTFLLEEKVYGFAFSAFNGIDFSDVDSIALHIDQSDPSLAAVDFGLSHFQAVSQTEFTNIPEPATMSLLILGLLLIPARKRF